MSTTLTASGFDSGSSGVEIDTSNSTFDGVSPSGLTFDASQFHSGTLSAKVAAAKVGTRGMWWGSTALGGTQTVLYGRLYVKFTAAPPVIARLVNFQSGGTVLAGIGINASRQVTVRNVKAGSTPSGGTSTTVLATNTWHRIEWSATVTGTSITVVVRIYAAGNVDSTTITETLTPSAMSSLAASVDSVMHGLAFSSSQTYTVWLDDVKLQVGSGATWLGPTTITPPPPNTGGDFQLLYDSNTDVWTTTSDMTGSGIAVNHPWAKLPSKMAPYAAAQSNWGLTAPENITSGTYADGTLYFQMAMTKLAATAAHARYGAGDYGCRFKFDVAATSIKTGRVQWDEEWTGGNLSKTSFMGWPDSGNWPAAGERDLNEQWNKPQGIQVTFHKFLSTAKDNNGQLINHATQVDTSKRVTIRVTILATKVVWEYKPYGTATWLKGFADITADPSWWQPDKGYHVEGAVAYSQQVSKGASTNDPNRQASVRRISNIKIWSGTTPGPGVDSTPPIPSTAPTPTAAVQGAGPSVLVTLGACTDPESGIDHYTLQRAYDSVSSPGTPDLATIVTLDNIGTTQFLDTGTGVGDKVYYREQATNGQQLANTFSAWSTMLTVTGPTDPPTCVGAVAPADNPDLAGDSATVADGNSAVIFSAPSTVGADTILVDPIGDGSMLLTILPADNAVDPNTGQALFPGYPPGPKTYTPKFYALNSAGSSKATVTVNVIASAGTTTTPTPRDIWVVPAAKAYNAGDLVDNGLYQALSLDQESGFPTIVRAPNGVEYCVDAGPAGPTVTTGSGGGDGGGGSDSEPFTDDFDDTF